MYDFLVWLYGFIMFGLFGLGVISTIIWVLRIFDDKEFPNG
jgi:hypothetical protein